MLNKLIQVYNTLSMVETHGQGTILMANSLGNLKEIIEEIQNGSKPVEDDDEQDS